MHDDEVGLMLRLTRRQALAGAVLTPLTGSAVLAANNADTVRADSGTYPTHAIRLISPYTAGGVGETIMRALAGNMEPRLGQKLILQAVSGVTGNEGTAEVAHSAPDGSELLIAATNNFVINQFVMKMTFDPLTALAPIAKVADVPLVLFANSELPPRNIRDLIAFTKVHPGQVKYGVPALGSVNHLLMERFKQLTGADLTCLPYRGSPQSVVALLHNEVQLLPIGLAAVGPRFRENKLTPLAVATAQRVPMLSEVPTMAEAAVPGFVAPNWYGLAAPAGTPDRILDILAAAVDEAQGAVVVKDRLASLGMLVPKETRAEFAASIKAEAELWSETAQRGNITVE